MDAYTERTLQHSLRPDLLHGLLVLSQGPVLGEVAPDDATDPARLRVHRSMEKAELPGMCPLYRLNQLDVRNDGVASLGQ